MSVQKTFWILVLLLFISIACKTQSDEIKQPGINSLPMYGNNKKDAGYILADQEFIRLEDSLFNGDRSEASKYFCKRGWDYFSQGVLDTAMFRLNQAWLLDSTNAEVYWGFADILSKKNQFNEAVPFFERAMKLLPNSSRLWHDASLTQGRLFFLTKNVSYLNTSIDYSKHAILLDPTNAMAYGQLTANYSYFMQKDSAKKYLKLTDKLDPRAVNPEVRKLLTGK